jgi:predicted dehydrogenase
VGNVRIGIIGVGQIAKNHLRQYAEIEGVEIVAACDIDGEELKRVAEVHEIPNLYEDYHKLLERDDLDAVDVCLHNTLHAPATIAGLEAGKHVYCEKPIAATYSDGLAMLEAAKATGKMLHIQLGTLYQKETKAAKALIDEGKLGNLYHARSTGHRRRGRPFVDGYGTSNFVKKEVAAGGALYDMGVYHIAQMLYLLDTPTVERISGKIYQETEMDPARKAESGYNVEELGLGLVRFAGGMTLDVIEAWAIHLDRFEGSYVVGTAGGIRLAPFGFFSTVGDMEMNGTFNLDSADVRWHRIRENTEAYDSSQQHWVAALRGEVALLPTAEIALQTMLIQEGIYASDRLGREVTADEVSEG